MVIQENYFFDNLNDDCVVHILSFLPTEHLNHVVVLVNHRLAQVRNNPSLDQTRIATITCTSNGLTVNDLCNVISNEWHESFDPHSNNCVLKIVSMDKLKLLAGQELNMVDLSKIPERRDDRLQSVTSLDLSTDVGKQQQVKTSTTLHIHDICSVARLFPNLQEVDLSYIQTTPSVMSAISIYGTPLTKIKWNGARHASLLPPLFTSRHASQLVELHLENAQITSLYGPLHVNESMLNDNPENCESYLWKHCPRLERVSIKGATINLYSSSPLKITQNMLMKLVRYHPTLRYLKSDLTNANICMLQKERPEITLVN